MQCVIDPPTVSPQLEPECEVYSGEVEGRV